MIRLQDSVDSPRPPHECFWFTVDFRNLPHWDPTVLSAAKRTPGALGEACEFELLVAFGPRRLRLRYRVTVFEPPRRAVLVADDEELRCADEVRFEPLAAGTRVVYTSDLELKSGGRLKEQAIKPVVALNSRRALAGLRRALAAEPTPPPRGLWRDLLDRALLPGALKFTAAGFRAARLPPVVDRMDGKTVVVTGATSGIGRAAALALARLGARLVLVGRDQARLAAVRAAILEDSGNDQLATHCADLSSMAQTRTVAQRILDSESRLDVVVNNAGALYADRELTAEGFERCFALNLLSPYVFTEALLPRLAAGSRVINVSSGGMYLQPLRLEDLASARGRYHGARAYARAKRGLVALSLHWAEAWRSRGIVVHAMHPGWVDTPGVVSALPAFHRAMHPFLRTPEQGADTIVWLAASPQAGKSSGDFWLDRRAHLTDVLPGTAVHRKTRQQLVAALAQAARSAPG
ncbi:MAG: SDR family NAD(P)-dependent oxidoreductase [Sinobacteraceae bacterium]|nr:SDR family NAD(P)-dependent oxidoreductase [Nevskiaceae bacterium]